MQPTVFQQALGAPFFRLPDAVRRLHSVRGRETWTGRARVERGRNPLARLCARLAGMPNAGDEVPLRIEFDCDPRRETWMRDFGGARLRSSVVLRRGLLHERLGPVHFRFALHANDGVIWWTVAGARLFGLLPLPAALFDGVRCREFEAGGQYRFDVEARLPLAGRVIRYEGWLAPG